jgi:gas vesicle protein
VLAKEAHLMFKNMFKNKFPFGKVTTAFLFGAVAGAAFGLLYAPFAGKKMQKKVGDVTDKVIDKVEEGVENVQGVFRKIANA